MNEKQSAEYGEVLLKMIELTQELQTINKHITVLYTEIGNINADLIALSTALLEDGDDKRLGF